MTVDGHRDPQSSQRTSRIPEASTGFGSLETRNHHINVEVTTKSGRRHLGYVEGLAKTWPEKGADHARC